MKILLLLLLVSCSGLNKDSLPSGIKNLSKMVCLSSEGNGRLKVLKRKYVYSYESALDQEQGAWALVMNFPLRNPETFELDWSQAGKVKFTSSIEDRIIRENKNINPKSLEEFTGKLGSLFEELVKHKIGEKIDNPKYTWQMKNKKLILTHNDKKLKTVFKNPVGQKYFGLISVDYNDSESQSYKLDLVVSNCLN